MRQSNRPEVRKEDRRAAGGALHQPSILAQLSQRSDASGRPWIGPAARLAGERLGVDLMAAGMLPRTTMDWGRSGPVDGGGRGLNPTEAALAARQRAEAALRSVGPELAGLLIDVCGFDKGLELLERERRWPVRSAKVVVRLALDALARHYGYQDAAEGAAKAASRAWAAEGPKPRIVAR
jgi:hypothetical protein